MLNSWQQIQGTDKALPVQLQKQQSPAQSRELWVFWALPGDWDGGKERVKRSWKDGTWNVFGSGRQHIPALQTPQGGGGGVPAPITPEQQPQNHGEQNKTTTEAAALQQTGLQQTQLNWDLRLLENWQEELDVRISD